jgi:hypothetical protein
MSAAPRKRRVVKVLPAPNADQEATREAKDRADKAAYDWDVLVLNAVLVAVAFLQCNGRSLE